MLMRDQPFVNQRERGTLTSTKAEIAPAHYRKVGRLLVDDPTHIAGDRPYQALTPPCLSQRCSLEAVSNGPQTSAHAHKVSQSKKEE